MARKYDWTGYTYRVTKPEFIRKEVKKLTDYDYDLLHLILVKKQNEARAIVENYHGIYSDKTVNQYKKNLKSINRLLSSFDCPNEVLAWEI